MTENIVAIGFADNSVTYQAYSTIKNSADALGVVSAVIVERRPDGSVAITEGDDSDLGAATAGGSLIGMLVGVLGGPLGMLLGTAVGGMTGALVDADKADLDDDTITTFASQVVDGRNAILLHEQVGDPSALDKLVSDLGGTVVRRPLDDVLSDLEAQEVAAEDAAAAARKALHEQRSKERKAKREERLDALKAKFHHDA